MGRNATNSLISLQYRTDWTFDKKTNGVKLYSLTVDEEGKQYIRAQFKFDKVGLKELIDCYQSPEKRVQWERHIYDSIDEVKSYPMATSMFYCKLKQKWGTGQRDAVILSHGIEMRGNRYYLTSRNVEHHQIPLKKNIARVQNRFALHYFEPTADGTGVKVTYITLVPSSEDGFTDAL